ncbi:MAG: CinA family nicotinamide mononucleotide deamidase-related protein, partial [Phycisphaerales bacterium]|nr:CinA family nicotinamide mononucleotide deamidase-related protein [Phycisphaerales bacterium]
MSRTAATISIGDELLAGETLDSNARLLARLLGEAGWRVMRHRVVADDTEAIAEEIRDAAEHVGLVLVTGGLGPTADDLAREGLAAAMVEPLVLDEEAEKTLEAFFAGRGYPMPESNRSQAMRPDSGRSLPNRHGTAPGVAARCLGTPVYLLPGPPHELKPMYEDSVRPELGDVVGTPTRELRAFGIGESLAAERISGLMKRDAEPVVGTTVSRSIITARIRARDAATGETEIDAVASQVREAWAPYIYGEGEDTLESVLGELLLERKATLASAESCTGGLIAWMVTRIPGSSAWYRGGWVTYENRRKQEDLGVSPEALDVEGAV